LQFLHLKKIFDTDEQSLLRPDKIYASEKFISLNQARKEVI
jgi:hypothetical protein